MDQLPKSSRPPGGGPIPRGIEVLVKKASVDPAFKALLLERRGAAADEIGLALDPAEAAMLKTIPAGQLRSTIERTKVEPRTRRVFLGKAASLMLAALGGSLLTDCDRESPTQGVRPETPPPKLQSAPTQAPVREHVLPEQPPLVDAAGIAPERPPEQTIVGLREAPPPADRSFESLGFRPSEIKLPAQTVEEHVIVAGLQRAKPAGELRIRERIAGLRAIDQNPPPPEQNVTIHGLRVIKDEKEKKPAPEPETPPEPEPRAIIHGTRAQ